MLNKGFLLKRKNNLNVEKRSLWIALLIVLVYSLTFYLFAICVRELFRYMSIMADSDYMLVLSPQENFFYNFFFATIATLTGISFGADLIIKTQFQLPAYVRHTIINDFTGLQWYSNYWIAKLGFFFGGLGSIILLNKEFDFYRDFWFMFPMISLVVFLNQWLRFRFFIKRNSSRLMLLSFIGVIIYSLCLSAISVMDYESFNHSVLKNTMSYNYSVDLPNADYGKSTTRKYYMREVFLGIPKTTNSDTISLLIKGSNQPISTEALSHWLENEKEPLGAYEMNQLLIALRIHKKITMKNVKSIFENLRELDLRKLWLVDDSGKGSYFNLMWRCQEILPDSTLWRSPCSEIIQLIQNQNSIMVSLQNDTIKLNDHPLKIAELTEELKIYINNHSPDYLIILKIDDNSTYQTFITLIDKYNKAIVELRQNLAINKFSKQYDFNNTQWQDAQLYAELTSAYPISLILLGDKEWKYIESHTR